MNEKLEKFNKSLKNKKIAIIGLGVSNYPLLKYLDDKSADVTIFNQKPFTNEMIEEVSKYNYKIETGDNYLNKLNGFDIIFRSPICMPNMPELEQEEKRGAIITSEIEQVMKLAPCKIIGVTGTEGKTTTTSIIYAILKEAGYKCYVGGNIGKPLFTEIEKMDDKDIIVLEMSSFQLMNMKVSPKIAVVTNVYPDHLNVHKSYEEYQEAKKNIFRNQDKNGIVVLNNDNEITKNFYKEATGKVIFFSSKVNLENGYIYNNEKETININIDGKSTKILEKNDIRLRGIHNYENICAALAATESLTNLNTQIKAIKEFKGVEHRLEFVRDINNVKYYNDSIGTSPASTIAGLNSFDENIILLAGGSDKGLDYTEIGEVIAKKVGTLILTGPTSEKIENATRIALKKENKEINIFHCNDMTEAVKTAQEQSNPGDVILLSPASASFDAFKNFEERGNKFKELVLSL